MTKYIHYGSKIFDIDRFEQISNFFIKPNGGLWASRVDSEFGWKEWNEDSKFAECNIDNSFTFTLKSNAKVIELFKDDDLLKLPRFDPAFPTISNYYLIDYEECIRQGIDAIEVRDISKGLYWSLYGYDCECILILNSDIVEVTE